MADSLPFNFDLPPVDVATHGPTGTPPIARSEHLDARHASATGALSVTCWTARQSAYLQLVADRAISDHEAAAVMHYPLASINSVRGALKKRGFQFTTDGFDINTWTDLKGVEHVTKRTRWTLTNTDARVARPDARDYSIHAKTAETLTR